MPKNEKQRVTEEIWLHYFNEYLFQREVISESERNRMRHLIWKQQGFHK